MKILIEEAVVRQALDALERYQVKRQDFDRFADEITALRAAIEQMGKQEPVAWAMSKKGTVRFTEDPDARNELMTCGWDAEPLYTHPAPAVPEKVEPSDCGTSSMDATVWAKAFAERFTVWSQTHGVESDTFGLMVGWFANAIMAGYDEAARRHPAHAVPEENEWLTGCPRCGDSSNKCDCYDEDDDASRGGDAVPEGEKS